MAKNLILAITVAMLVLCQPMACVRLQNFDYLPVKAPAEVKDNSPQLIAQILESEKLLKRLDKNEKRYKQAEHYERLADDMVKHAVTEKDEITKFKQLQMANEIMNNPVRSVESLKAKLAARARAQQALDLAKAEKDPKKQKELLKQAEDLIIEFKTGKKPIHEKKPDTTLKAPFVSIDQVEGLFGQDLDRYADKIAKSLMDLAKSTTDAAFRNSTLKEASLIVAHPKKNLREYARRQNIRQEMAKVAEEMQARFMTEKDAKIRNILGSRITMLQYDPVGFYDQLVEEEEKKIIAMAEKKAKEVGKMAEKEKDLTKSEAMMKEAMLYNENPLNAWANQTEHKLRQDILLSAPVACRAAVQDLYALGKDALDKTFTELTLPPKPVPVSGIVNFAQFESEMTKKINPMDDEFGTDKHYIKLSFTGWLHKNSDLAKEEAKLLGKKKTKAKKADKKGK